MARSGARGSVVYRGVHRAGYLDAALALVTEIEEKAERLREQPKLYRPGRVRGTREMVVRPNYVVVYSESMIAVTILRVLHAAQMWPPVRP